MSITTVQPILPQPEGTLSVRLTDKPSPSTLTAWARLVADNPGGDVAQLPGWARLRGSVGFTARYLLVFDGAELVGGAQVLERTLPLLGRLGYLPYGPLVAASHAGDHAVHTAICDALAELGRRLRVLFVQPPTGADALGAGLLARGFRPSDAEIAPTASLRLDLRNDLHALRGGLSKRLRTWTNCWESRGVSVRLGTEADLVVLAELVADSGRHQGFAAVTEDYLRTLYRELAGDRSGSGDAVLFVGELNGAPAAVALFTRCAGVLTLRFAGMDRSEAASRCNVPAAVQWNAIRWAQLAGLRWFDFGGIGAAAADALAAGGDRGAVRGVDRFKASFGGELHRYPPAVELIGSALPRIGYDLCRRWPAGRRGVELARRLLRTGRLRTPPGTPSSSC